MDCFENSFPYMWLCHILFTTLCVSCRDCVELSRLWWTLKVATWKHRVEFLEGICVFIATCFVVASWGKA